MWPSTRVVAISLVFLVSAEPEGAVQCPCYNSTLDGYGFGCAAHDVNGSTDYPEFGS